jgi:tRNA(Ile)-lysidine synthase
LTKLEKKLRASLRKLEISKQDRILVAVSGGADSTALLDALARWKRSNQLFAGHLNHLLRGAESDADETFVRAITGQLKVPVFIAQQDVAVCAAQEKKNLEATARRLRYEFLQRAAEQYQASVIVTAHTQDDQVETLMMRLLRGTGAGGLRGILAQVELQPSLRLVRPMLEITRAEVIEHCMRYQLKFRNDSSNNSTEFTRNRVRHEILPLLQTLNPDFGATLIRTAYQLNEDDTHLQSEAVRWIQELSEGAALNFKPLCQLHAAVRRRVVRLWIAQTRGDLRRIGASHLMAIDHLITQGTGNRFVELPSGWRVYRLRDQLKMQPLSK